uniref:M polyprotein n=1 Tax=Tofla virus TaxID=1615758 RepID=A0A125T1E9_9VIRU|nr:glycoprotein [Tofla virus]
MALIRPFILIMMTLHGCTAEESTTEAVTEATTTANPLATDTPLRRRVINQRILSVLGLGPDTVSTKLEQACKDIYTGECKPEDMSARVPAFFMERNKSICFNDILEKKSCLEHLPTLNPNWKSWGMSATEVAKYYDTKIKLFFTSSMRLSCFAANLVEPDQFVEKMSTSIQATSGPAKQNVRSMHCTNIVWSHVQESEVEVIHVLLSTVPLRTKNCLSRVNMRQCTFTKQSDGKLDLPSYKHGGKYWIPGAYTMSVSVDRPADGPCEITTTCITEGSEVKPGLHRMRGFETTIVVPSKRPTGRRLMGTNSDSNPCSSGTFLGEGSSAQVVGDKNDGPGDHITFCNGTYVSKMKLGKQHGCFTVRRVKAYRNCHPRETPAACVVDEELRECEGQKCMNIHIEVRGLVKITRGKNVEVITCDRDCLARIPSGKGDIQIDCPGGRQHYLETNVVDINCPGSERFHGLMLYFCRMSHRPKTCISFFIWLAVGYGLTCITGTALYYLLLFVCKAVKGVKRRFLMKGDFCIKCEQKCATSLEQALHDENCSYNLCPYCGNRLPEDSLCRHVPNCPKRKERLEEIDLYLDYQLLPFLLYILLKLALNFGILLKRLSWFAVLLILFLVTLAPVQGNPTQPETNTESDNTTLSLLLAMEALLALSLILHVAFEAYRLRVRAQLKREKEVSEAVMLRPEAAVLLTGKPLCLGDWDTKSSENSRQGAKFRLVSLVRFNAAVVLVVLVVGLFATSAMGFDSGPLPKGIWEEEQELVQECGQECSVQDEECLCPGESKNMRKLLFFKGLNSVASRMLNTHKLMTSISIDAPWGAIQVESTYKPKLPVSNIELAWNSVEEQGDKIILSGKSTSILKLEEKTGVQWSLGAESASEEKRLLVSVLDYTQVYSSTFQYITGDRTISEWPKATCTGDCPDRCSCRTSTCLYKTWPHSRNWRCNPTWCWGVGTGCTCCGVDIERPFNKYFAVKWSTDYVRTDVLVCVELTDLERHCDVVEAGSQFVIGPVRVVVSDPQNVQTKLPPEVLTVQKLEKHSHLDLMHVTNIISAKNACKLQSCTHGSPGDMQILHTDNLIQNSHDDGANLAEVIPEVNTTWMSWEGCDLDYYCTTGSWPSCTFTGVNTENSDSFENLLNTEANLVDRYHFHSKRIFAQGSTLQMDLKGRPITGGGELTVLVDIKGLELHSKKVVLKGLEIKSLSCTGCYSCSSGVSCSVDVKIEKPDEFTVHLRSTDPNTVISEGSIVARKLTGGPQSKVKAFTALKAGKICVEIVEKSYCPSCKDSDVKKCINADLQPPKDILLEHKGIIIKHQNNSCNSGIQCWSESTTSFLNGVGSFFKNYFGSIAAGVLLTLLPVLAVIFFFLFGDKIAKVFLCLRCCKGLSRRSRMQGEKEEELKKMLKKFSKGGELFSRGSRDARTVAMVLAGKGKDYKEQV